jgi:hypothetical protein
MTQAEIATGIDWASLGAQLDVEGYAVVPRVLSDAQVHALTALCDGASTAHSVPLASRDLGHGDLIFAAQDVPPCVAALQANFYEHLAPVANRWNAILDKPLRHPPTLNALLDRNRQAVPLESRSHFSVLRTGDYQALHQCSDGVQEFPLQMVALLSEPGEDFSGGAFVMTEQRPRMQSRPIVLPLRRGDVAVIAVNQRPHAGTKGPYRVNLKHAISQVHSGRRVGLELLFHDARPAARRV